MLKQTISGVVEKALVRGKLKHSMWFVRNHFPSILLLAPKYHIIALLFACFVSERALAAPSSPLTAGGNTVEQITRESLQFSSWNRMVTINKESIKSYACYHETDGRKTVIISEWWGGVARDGGSIMVEPSISGGLPADCY